MPAHMITNQFQFVDANGAPVSGGYVKAFEPNGSSTPKALYTNKDGATGAVTNNHALNALGQFDSGTLYGNGDYYFEVYYADDTLADSFEYIEGEGSGNNAATEWTASVTPTYISATSFSVPGDLTSDFHVNRRVKTENTGGTVYSTITASAYTTSTLVTIANDSGTLDAGLSSVELGFLRADTQSMPASKAGLIDENGNEVVKVAATASAVNEITVTNAATGDYPEIAASGEADTPLSLNGNSLSGRAQGAYVHLDSPVLLASPSATSASWVTLTPSELSTAKARIAKIEVRITSTLSFRWNADLYQNVYIQLRKDSGESGSYAAFKANYVPNTSSTLTSQSGLVATGIRDVNLTGSFSFDYLFDDTAVTVNSAEIYLVGYYV